ncbi:FAD dependent sulfhydryl oxidase Erv2 [Lentithecium fluviatile CBS 122367]|uniref:Sulfhydryl oxidase n=1 Tax=Lentithecium fluviatile CBS 122367 TaxID=1168545 RepID=A0A6G1J3G3_9PLEO|nr:FAD dependent sulfhydryl oxidase Erv2 [Lentithecium fluviatile CBS 122367]
MAPTGTRSRFVLLALFCIAMFSFLLLEGHREPPGFPSPIEQAKHSGSGGAQSGAVLTGHAIAPKLGNATAKAELGRAAWKVLHTTFARFPEKPTEEEKEALRSYVHLFQRLYPCGECAEHFGKVLAKYPPQVSSRSAAAMWGCMVHNIVNKRLHKPEFNCENIGDAYDCGCGDEEGKDKDKAGAPA